jgi:hypothetical protein
VDSWLVNGVVDSCAFLVLLYSLYILALCGINFSFDRLLSLVSRPAHRIFFALLAAVIMPILLIGDVEIDSYTPLCVF